MRIVKLFYATEAKVQLRKIHAFISNDSPKSAKTVVAAIRNAAKMLAKSPGLAHLGKLPGTFEWVVRQQPYIIVFKIYPHDPETGELIETLAIVAIYHGAQNRPADSTV